MTEISDGLCTDIQAAIALIIGPLHYWLLSAQAVTPAVIETLVPMLSQALGATGRK